MSSAVNLFSFMLTVLITFMITRHYYLKQVKFVTNKVVSAQKLAESSQNTNDDLEVKLQSLELELQERKNKMININEQLEQSQRSLKSCTAGQATLESEAATCNQQVNEKRKELENKQKELDRLEVALRENSEKLEGQVNSLTSSTNATVSVKN